MKNLVFVLLTLAGLTLGCSKEELDSGLDSSLLQSKLSKMDADEIQRPFKFKGEGIFTLDFNTAACPGLAQLTIDGTGRATHLGNFTVNLIWCTNRADINYATGTQVAANGDELYFELLKFTVGEDFDEAIYEYSGGTGRFKDARGEVTERLTYYPIDEVTTGYINEATGWISY
jgi:hypothetical protein